MFQSNRSPGNPSQTAVYQTAVYKVYQCLVYQTAAEFNQTSKQQQSSNSIKILLSLINNKQQLHAKRLGDVFQLTVGFMYDLDL